MINNPQENGVLKRLTHTEASYIVNAKATYYPNSTEIYVPNKPYEKLIPGMESDRRATQGGQKPSSDQMEDNLERSLRLTKKRMKEYIFMNKFDMFATFTFGLDRDNQDRCRQKMADWLKSQQKYHGKFEYLIVSELHKNGVIHFHALLQGFTGRIKRSINPHTNRPLVQNGRKVFEFSGYTHGFTNVKLIEDSQESRIRTGFYVMKYITKDMPTFANKNRYWASRNLKLPRTEDNPEEWYLVMTPDHLYQTEYGTIYIFDNKHIEIFLP